MFEYQIWILLCVVEKNVNWNVTQIFVLQVFVGILLTLKSSSQLCIIDFYQPAFIVYLTEINILEDSY